VSAILAILVDGTSTAIINTGLPYLQGITASSPDQGSWILTTFNAAYYSSILLSPWLVARFGRRNLILTALLSFSALSVLLADTTNFGLFLVLRFLQGACLGCVFVPAVILFFTSLSASALKYAAPGFVLAAISGSTLGTLIGGFVADQYGGNLVFLPAAIATAVTAALIFVAVSKKDVVETGLRFDGVGVALSIVTFGAMQYLSNEGERRNWFDDSTIAFATFVLAASLGAFVYWELFGTRNPHVNLRMFVNYRNLAVGSLINIVIGATGYSVTTFVGYLAVALAATPTVAGELIPVRLLTYVIGVPAAFLLSSTRTLSVRAVVVIGVLGSSAAFLWFGRLMTTTADMTSFVGVSLVFGLFFAMLSQPIGTLVVGSIPLPLLAAGLSIYKLSSPVGTMIATGFMQNVLDRHTVAVNSLIAGDVTLGNPAVDQYVYQHHGSAAGLAGVAAVQSQTLAYSFSMQLYAVILLAVIPVIFFAKLGPPQAAAAKATGNDV
jgi:DHA2 family multidrug resistance protein